MVLAGEGHLWEFEGRAFDQRPLKLRRLSAVLKEVIDTVIGNGRTAILDQFLDSVGDDGEVTGKAREALTPIITRLVIQVPEALPKVCALILEPETSKVSDTETYLGDHMNARQGVAVIKLFIEQNEIGELLQDFFGLMGTVQTSMTTEEIETESPEESSASESDTTADE